METVQINIKNTLQSPYCVDSTDGEKIYHLIKSTLVNNQIALISFEGIELIVASFLNVAVGQLFKDYEPTYIHSHLQVQDRKSVV